MGSINDDARRWHRLGSRARRLVEADGGRARIAVNAQPTITLIFPTTPTGDEEDQ